MNEVCTFKPTIRVFNEDGTYHDSNKISPLYEKLLEKTGPSKRPVANLLYALALQPEVRNLFDESEFTKDGEIKFESFWNKVNGDRFVFNQSNVVDEMTRAGFVDSTGRPIVSEDPFDIIDRAILYNNESNLFTAEVVRSDDGLYQVKLNQTTSENIGEAKRLFARKKAYDTLMDTLSNCGFNINLTKEAKKSFNPLTVYNTINQLRKMIERTKTNPFVSIRDASLLLELMKDTDLAQAFTSRFNEYAPYVLSFLTGNDIASMIPEDIMNNIRESFYDMAKNLVSSFYNKGKSITEADYSRMFNPIDKGSYNKKIDNVKVDVLSKTIRELDEKFHYNFVRNKPIDLNSISGITNRLITLLQKNLDLLDLSLDSRQMKKVLKKVLYDHSIGNDVLAIKTILDDVAVLLGQMVRDFNDSNNLNGSPTVKAINKASGAILALSPYIRAYKPVLQRIKRIEMYNKNGSDISEDVEKQIKEDATKILDSMESLENQIVDKQKNCATALLMSIIPDDLNDLEKEDIINAIKSETSKGLNFWSRYFLAPTETNDESISMLAEFVKLTKRNLRDPEIRGYLKEVRQMDNILSLAGSSNTDFMLYKNKNGRWRIKSEYDWDTFYEKEDEEKSRLKKLNLSKEDYNELLELWRKKNMVYKVLFKYKKDDGTEYLGAKVRVPDVTVQNGIYYKKDWDEGMTLAQKDYYYHAMAIKSWMHTVAMPLGSDIFKPILASKGLVETAGSDITKIPQFLADWATKKKRQDDGEDPLFNSGQIRETVLDYDDKEVLKVPLLFVHDIEDLDYLSHDFSGALMAFVSSTLNYRFIHDIENAVLVTADYLKNKKTIKHAGKAVIGLIVGDGSELEMVAATEYNSNASLFIDDLVKREIYNLKKEVNYIGNGGLSMDRIADALTQYTSISQLTVNLLGAEANLMVGKIQMLIDSISGEFFNMKDYGKATVEYGKLLFPYLGNLSSNHPDDMLSLIMERFNADGSFYQSMKEQNFFNSPVSKIFSNMELMMLYGGGEHILRGETLLACLMHVKCLYQGKKCSLYDVLDRKEVNGIYELVIKEGATLDDKKQTPITEKVLQKIERRARYCSDSLHGAFNEEDKGMAHRYWYWRLFMNFRQWMPAHYARRFRGRDWNANLMEYREGYYNTLFKYIGRCLKGLKDGKLNIAAEWNNLSEHELYNMKRAFAELGLLILMSAAICVIPDEKDKKGHWAYRNMLYVLKRLRMETLASSLSINAVTSFMQILNSPFASINTIDRLSGVFNLGLILETVQSGPHEGWNKWLNEVYKNLPFAYLIEKQVNLGERNDYFQLFGR